MQYDFTLVPFGGQDVSAIGQYIKYKSGLGAIRVRMSQGGFVDLTPGQGIRLPKEFTAFNITDRSGNANAGVILAGDYEFQDDSINGAVSIIDGGKISTLQQSCFMGTFDAPPINAQYNSCVLGNPAGNLKNIVVESIAVSSTFSGPVVLTQSNSAVGASVVGINKAGNLAPNSTGLMGAGAVTNLALAGAVFWKLNMAANSVAVIKLAEPIIIIPGRSISVLSISIGQGLTACFEWREDAV